MRKLMTALCFSVFALAAMGMGPAQSGILRGDVKFDVPATAQLGDAGFRLIAEGSDGYPAPEDDDAHPDLRFPGEPHM